MGLWRGFVLLACYGPAAASIERLAEMGAWKLGGRQIPRAGKVMLAAHLVENGWQPMNLKSIQLIPAEANP